MHDLSPKVLLQRGTIQTDCHADLNVGHPKLMAVIIQVDQCLADNSWKSKILTSPNVLTSEAKYK